MNAQDQTQPTRPLQPWDWSWSLWPLLPLYPYGNRRTIRREVVKDTIWTFEQVQGILYVVVPIRMTVVKLNDGGLFVYAPVAPTPECIRLLKELVAVHGDVKYIILPTTSGLEHKVFVGPFARWFRDAQVFVAPNQWSFPVNLPLSWLGFPLRRTHTLPADSSQTPFADQFDYAMLGPIGLGIGPFEEVAFFHKASRTLLVTDAVLSVPAEPPAIVQLDPYPLLFHARDHAFEPVEDSEAARRKGWQRTVLFSFYFRPSALEVVKTGESLRDALKAPDRSRKAYFGWFPFRWNERWQQSFEALRGGGRPFVAPILQTLILNRAPRDVLAWADRVAGWNFQRVIPCHLDAPLAMDSSQFRQAFAFLEKHPASRHGHDVHQYLLPQEDFALLQDIEAKLNRVGIVPPAGEKV